MYVRYPNQDEARWPFVPIAAAFWALAIFMLHINAEFMAILLF